MKAAAPLEIEYTRPFVYDYQRQIIDAVERFTVTEAATKVGKSASHLIWAFEQPLKLNLKAGQGGWWVAPVYAQAEIMYNRLKNQITDKNFFKYNDSKLLATYPTGATLQFKSAERPDNLYGDDVYFSVFDEFTRARELAWTALRTTLTSTGGPCKFIGNVKGRKGWGHKLAMKAKSGEDPNWKFFKITAYDAAEAGMKTKDGRPFIEEIEAAKKDMPEAAFKELYLAEAAEDGSNPFGETHISRAVYPMSEDPAVCYGIDLAKSVDFTVIVGLDGSGRICHFDRFQKDWHQTKQTIMKLPRSVPIRIDSTGAGDPIAEDLGMVMGNIDKFVFTQHSKQQIMVGLAAAIQSRRITVIEGVMKEELDSFEFSYTATGTKYTAPEGFHDDCVCALALANSIFVPQAQVGHYSIF